MSYEIVAVFSTPDDDDHYADYVVRDIITDDDWTNLNYWDDIGFYISVLISDAESDLRLMFPHGHDYSLSCVHVLSVDNDSEEVDTH